MQTIPFSISSGKIASTTANPILIAGESMTSEITLISVPEEWMDCEYRMFITTPGKKVLDSISITLNTPIGITNAMLDKKGRMIVEFGAYGQNGIIHRTLITESCKLSVHGSRNEDGSTDPDAVPSIISELLSVLETAKSSEKWANVTAKITRLVHGSLPDVIISDTETGKDIEFKIPDAKDGVDGLPGKDGVDGLPGKDGVDGLPGKDGVDGLPGKDGVDGLPGKDGVDGLPGKDGVDTIWGGF